MSTTRFTLPASAAKRGTGSRTRTTPSRSPPSELSRKGTLKKFERQVVTLTYSAQIQDEFGEAEAKKKHEVC